MSYILDALRRADAERERDALPGLHTQAVPVGLGDTELENPPRPWAWLIVLAFAVLLGLVVWLWLARSDAPDPTAPIVASALPPAPTPTRPLPSVSAQPAPAGVDATAPAPARTGSAELARDALMASDIPPTATAATPPRKPAALATPPATAAAPATTAKPGAAAAPNTTASAADAKAPVLAELPEEVRRGLPTITVGGSIYSKSATSRMLVINGQVFHEGDELTPELKLEQIKPKAAVLNFKGFRYEVAY